MMKQYNCSPPGFLERVTQTTQPENKEQDLKRCLNLVDLMSQAMAHMIGTGIFVLTPGVIALIAGPGLVFSYLIAGVVMVATVLCYMDLGARYKGIGNAYVYMYSTFGELAAILIATFFVWEVLFGIAFVSIGFGNNFDRFLLDSWMSNTTLHYAEALLIPSYIAENINPIAILLITVCCIINCIGVKSVVVFNEIAMIYALLSLGMFCGISAWFGSWETFAESTDPETGQGGITPYGWRGVAMGTAVVVVSYAGFETTVCLSSEAINPSRDIPRAVFFSYLIVAAVYTTTTFFMAYLTPWYLISKSTGMPHSMERLGLTIPMYILIGGILLTSSSVAVCTVTTVSRLLLVISEDGLIFRFFSTVAQCNKSPVIGTIVSSLAAITVTLLLSYEILIHLISGGTLLTLTAVCLVLIVTSYSPPPPDEEEGEGEPSRGARQTEGEGLAAASRRHTNYQTLGDSSGDDEGEETRKYVDGQVQIITGLVAVYGLLIGVFVTTIHWPDRIELYPYRLTVIVPAGIAMISILIYIDRVYLRFTRTSQSFVCPAVPYTPGLGALLNIVLFSFLDGGAHTIILAYFVGGTIFYFGYGYFHSTLTAEKQRQAQEEEVLGGSDPAAPAAAAPEGGATDS